MKNYIDLLRQTLTWGKDVQTRNGIRRTLYGAQLHFDLREGFPLVTTRFIPWKNPSVEMLWFLRGDTDTKFLHEHNVRIWDANAEGSGYVGNAYGYQWRHGFGYDQIAKAVRTLQRDPTSTRNVVLSWNPAQLNATVLPPCHIHFQLHSDGHRLRLQFAMRSTDLFLGLPTNIAGYAILANLFAKVSGQMAVELICDLSNIHIYENQFDVVAEQLTRNPLPLPYFEIQGDIQEDLYGIEPWQLQLSDYQYHPALKVEMVV